MTDRKHLKSAGLFLIIPLMLLFCGLSMKGETPVSNFSFTTREGKATTLYHELADLQPQTQIWLLLFDPDCNECRQLKEKLKNDPSLNKGLKNQTIKLFAIFPSYGIPEANDPDYISFLNQCKELPAEWVVGIDMGSIIETDAVSWETLPKLLKFQVKEAYYCEPR